jgi:AcrR family transcriptional regulator
VTTDSSPRSADSAVGRHRLLAETGASDTKTKILEAAFRQLAKEGYAALSLREIGKEAGVNHALINYHFRTKDQLVIAVLDEANRHLLERQRGMYAQPGGFAHKWAQARQFYKSDLASGFVRVQAELWAASLSNPGLRATFLPRLQAWKQVVLGAVRDALATLEAHDVAMPRPYNAEVIATWISEFWLGMEFADLLDPKGERTKHEAALDAMQVLLEDLDARLRKAGRAPRQPARVRRSTLPKK